MRREEIAHILRAACRIVDDADVIVVGSQSILGTYDEDDLPPAATLSEEADVAFKYDWDRSKADRVTGAIGEFSDFHIANDYYVDGVSMDLIKLPNGWEDRLVAWDLVSSSPSNPRFLDPHDLAVSKLCAHRDKDREFVAALLDAGLLDAATIRQRADMLPEAHRAHIPTINQWLDGHRGPKNQSPSGTSQPTSTTGQARRSNTGQPGNPGKWATPDIAEANLPPLVEYHAEDENDV